MLRFLVLMMVVFAFPVQASERILVFAAASQKDALEEIGKLYKKECVCKIVFSFAATSTLARQIDAGAGADVFISANRAWADWLEIRGHLASASRHTIAGNRLVIASSKGEVSGLDILGKGRFAMADPISVPAGIYAREALESLGVWDVYRKHAVFSENVRVALSSVRRGDLVSGIVYQSDLTLSSELQTQYVFPESSHTEIQYVAAKLKGSWIGEGFIRFLRSEAAQRIFHRFGFLPVSVTKQG